MWKLGHCFSPSDRNPSNCFGKSSRISTKKLHLDPKLLKVCQQYPSKSSYINSLLKLCNGINHIISTIFHEYERQHQALAVCSDCSRSVIAVESLPSAPQSLQLGSSVLAVLGHYNHKYRVFGCCSYLVPNQGRTMAHPLLV
mmetsp:Transcript_33319/g.6021  ORF Transcript_33319/g.6021 Transcript_33319/m.6021 type:complete len:142 (+) Transcript_33319:2694-3119(+)